MKADSHPFFRGLGDDEIRLLTATATLLDAPQGTLIFDAGDSADAIYLVLEGRVAIAAANAEGTSLRAVGECAPGSVFGEVAIVTNRPRSARATAITPVRLLRIDEKPIRQVWHAAPAVARKIGEAISENLKTTTKILGEAADRQDRLVTLGNMVGSLAHDFRTPLTLINLNAQLVETVASTRDPELAELLAKHTRNIEAQIERMLGMIEEVSDFSRGKLKDDYEKMPIGELFETFRFLNGTLWEHRGIAVEFSAEKIAVEVAPRKMLRVLQNLIGNAVEALEDTESARIVVEARAQGKTHAIITVTDNGPGIPAHIREKFWEPFVTSGKAHGTGLGTAICRTLVEAHGGTIDFETETGRGTRFTIRLPLRRRKKTEA